MAENFSNLWQKIFQIYGRKVFKFMAENFSNLWQKILQIYGRKFFKFYEALFNIFVVKF